MGESNLKTTDNRCKAPTVQQILDRETRPVPPALRETVAEKMPAADLPVERYTSREFHDLEMARMWNRVWQMACREEDIAKPGDYLVYEIGDHSVLLLRTQDGDIRAYHNVCLHRGRLLKTGQGHAAAIRCPFHGFTWKLDGSIHEIPCRWDFAHKTDEEFRLPEVKTGLWGGFVFINLDPEARPLADYLDVVPQHFERWDLGNRYKSAHVGKIVAANWKVCAEAFMESYHVIATHPQIMPSTADANTQYDVYPGKPHFNRMITAMGVASPHLGGDAYPDEKILDSMMAEYAGREGNKISVKLPPGQTARSFTANMLRGMIGGSSGWDLKQATDSEMLDAIQYFVFPNLFPWGGFFNNIVYRFRPDGHDPDSCLMEVMLLAPVRKGGERPPPAKYRLLGSDEAWASAKELGLLGPVFDQDMSNIPFVQKGLKAAVKPGVTLGNYQESRIRHLHRTLDDYLKG
ncbi:MAG: aromatic ring-hydroxylating dioxygenase subunit alpha [Deltaproteobacteria bacterium]|nr:aromatic ring-hydroxylating dioxygenase subunit alpha [Deltaproteobacteria bacterium]